MKIYITLLVLSITSTNGYRPYTKAPSGVYQCVSYQNKPACKFIPVDSSWGPGANKVTRSDLNRIPNAGKIFVNYLLCAQNCNESSGNPDCVDTSPARYRYYYCQDYKCYGCDYVLCPNGGCRGVKCPALGRPVYNSREQCRCGDCRDTGGYWACRGVTPNDRRCVADSNVVQQCRRSCGKC